jgi:hypothetical protein
MTGIGNAADDDTVAPLLPSGNQAVPTRGAQPKETAVTVATAQQRIRAAQPVQIQQYSLPQILAVWAAVTIPMSVLSWIVTPWLSHRLGSRDPFIDALLICFNVGLLWMITLVLILVRREQGVPCLVTRP